MNKPFSKSLHNIDRNITGRFGVCACYWSGNFGLRVGEKTHFEKTTFKDCSEALAKPSCYLDDSLRLDALREGISCSGLFVFCITLLRASDNCCHLLCERFFRRYFAILRFKFLAESYPGSALAHHVTHLNESRCQKLTPANEISFLGLRPLWTFKIGCWYKGNYHIWIRWDCAGETELSNGTSHDMEQTAIAELYVTLEC